jgi:UDP-N-acetyl-D-mannosaminuronic acid dehydrogenase
MKVNIIGLGYVGLTLAIHLVQRGMVVHGVDISDRILTSLGEKKAHFFEKDFDCHVKSAIDSGRFTFGKKITPNNQGATTYIITVGTPLAPNKLVNLEPIKTVCKSVAPFLADGDLVILRSTVRMGVTRDVVKPILDQSGKAYSLSFSPERTIEGAALEELSNLPQIVSGIDPTSLQSAVAFFQAVSKEVVPLELVEEAEMIKLINNSERDLSFALANEIALMCDSKGLNAHRVIHAANYKYARSNLKRPGPVGGPCLEKDPYIFTEAFLNSSYVPRLFKVGRSINEDVISLTLAKFFRVLEKKGPFQPEKIAILGFAFKGSPPTGDLRGSLVYSIIELLKAKFPEAEIIGHDYLADSQEIAASGVSVASTVSEAISGVGLVVFQNNHPQYSKEPWSHLERLFAENCAVLDFWNQMNGKEQFIKHVYQSIGNIGVPDV